LMQNFVIDMCENFHNDRALVLWKSDNTTPRRSTATTLVALWDIRRGNVYQRLS